MYIKNVHILYYVLFGVMGMLVGQFVDWCNKRLPERKKVFTFDFFREFKINYPLMIINTIMPSKTDIAHLLTILFLNIMTPPYFK